MYSKIIVNQLEQLEAAKAAGLALICYTLVFTSLQMFCNLQQMLPICRTYLKDIEKVCKGPMNGRTNLIYLLYWCPKMSIGYFPFLRNHNFLRTITNLCNRTEPITCNVTF